MILDSFKSIDRFFKAKSVVFIGAIPGQPFENECLHEKIERKQTEKSENPDQGKSQCAEGFHVVTIRDFNFG